MTKTLASLLQANIDRDPSRPLVTYYDRLSGERTELSGATFANWVAKTANMMRDDYRNHHAAMPLQVELAIPMHWQQLVLAFGTWAVGGCVRTSDWFYPDILVVPPADMLDLERHSAGAFMVASLDPMGYGYGPRPDGVLDFTTEVRAHDDHFVPEPFDMSAKAHSGWGLSHQMAASTATDFAAQFGFTPQSRVLVTANAADEVDMLTWAVAPLVGAGSLVLVHGADDVEDADWIDRIAAQERITMRLGEGDWV